ncbi:MAG: hypothetical protein DWQ31_07435 [Planctomycetota bacterium]|nr:MAG: hypothetical protein DWQ31_07435 [Planctomycetota bacterium]REJ96241.1 MAG: hypothetical protein DWQ35_04905 [Planctomycetota bacterium]REK31476.1 MAG: hypothetical protein DWQ42_00690 [Planctomycetota bacterium]REK40706.1 MAG: hypothetical protein DWQ46_15830 [Planctomycetota bacterium]
MSEIAETGHHGEHEHAHHGSIGPYIAVFVALCVLTAISFLTNMEFWQKQVPESVSRTIMMAVSCAKALLVIMFFMHLKYEANWKYVLTIPAGLMSIFLVLMLVPDIGLRTDNGLYGYSKERWRNVGTGLIEADHGDHEGDADAPGSAADHESTEHESSEHDADEGEGDSH